VTELTRLTEQQIMEWQSHLKHIDEVMARTSRTCPTGPAWSSTETLQVPATGTPSGGPPQGDGASEAPSKSARHELYDVLTAVLESR
jgi:hypothetical protein